MDEESDKFGIAYGIRAAGVFEDGAAFGGFVCGARSGDATVCGIFTDAAVAFGAIVDDATV